MSNIYLKIQGSPAAGVVPFFRRLTIVTSTPESITVRRSDGAIRVIPARLVSKIEY